MMGAGQTLSVGIAIGHYKAPLGQLVHSAFEERELAKDHGERLGAEQKSDGASGRGNAFSIRRFTRNGAKSRLTLRWDAQGVPERESRDMPSRLSGYCLVRRVLKEFREGGVSGIPYKLRELEDAVVAVWQEQGPESARDARLRVTESFAKSVCVNLARGSKEAFALWWSALSAHFSEGETPPTESLSGAEEGLALCRFLSGLGQGGEE
jgi:hypothetical protein